MPAHLLREDALVRGWWSNAPIWRKVDHDVTGKSQEGRNMKLARGLAGGAEAALALGGLPSSIIVNAALSEVDTLFMEDRWLK